MLKSTRIYFSNHVQALQNSLRAMLTTPLATMMTLMVIAVALALPALFWLFSINIKQLTTSWQQGEHIALYLEVSLAESERNHLFNQIKKTPGVAKAVLISPNEGLQTLQNQAGLQDIHQYMTDNPLPAVIDVTPQSFTTSTQLEALFLQLKSYPHVEQAQLDMQWVTRLYAVLKFVTTLAKACMALLGFAVVMIIGNTLRLAIHRHHEEVQVLKLIGATDNYIARPFLYSGVWFGLLGALFALVLVYFFTLSLSTAFQELLIDYQVNPTLHGFSFPEIGLFVAISTALGWLGAQLSIKRQLGLIEP